ncbi:facilitated trehalose transporter Tret1-2 homolog [Eurytemora carolleeae]|uniref:facilitated trehalose transporter Tret1-2 homolog n=1 Tax=Eurytemora carolleeae TaxID=1294199 RepID=UPI000C793D66|nr:facilitated trehalose transporter Tret1-2 homolog [Eurytemora carolleeae]|eukprot:XP_023343145.1 facilitated trehalose transporter Tret1-2 homolog [Eurytemora affinis]
MLFSGKFAIEFYAVDIFIKAGGHIDKYASAVIIAIIQLVGSLLFIPLVRVCSRKLLIISSSFIMSSALVVLGCSMYAQVEDSLMSDMAGLDWIPLLSVVVYMVAAPLGLCSIPFMYVAEFYPAELRSLLGGMTIAISNIELFLVVKTFPNLEESIGDHGVFWLYAGACFLAIFFTFSYIPETKDKSLMQVEGKFDRLRSTARASPWVTPLPSPSVSSVRKLQVQTLMFTQ